jgi:hypothetical protein
MSITEINQYWKNEVVRETNHLVNITWYFKAMLTRDRNFATKRYCNQDGYSIMGDIHNDQELSLSILHQARKTYNENYRLNSGRVKIIKQNKVSSGTGQIVCYDQAAQKYQVCLDVEGSESQEISHYNIDQLMPTDNINDVHGKGCHDDLYTRNCCISSGVCEYALSFKPWVYDKLPIQANGRIQDSIETYKYFNHLVDVSNKTIESYRSELTTNDDVRYSESLHQFDKHVLSLPYRTVDESMAMACLGQSYFDRTNNTSFNERTILKSIGNDNIVINQSTLNRLLPGGSLNDELVNLGIRW